MICYLCYHEVCSDVLQDCYMVQVTIPQPKIVSEYDQEIPSLV